MPLDALTTQRIRALEIVVAWLIEQSLMEDTVQEFDATAMSPTYILELAENIQSEAEDA